MKRIIILSVVLYTILGWVNATEKKNNKILGNSKAQVTYGLKGKVFDVKKQEALAGVAVMAGGQKVYTDLEGNFELKNLAHKNCEIVMDLISYEEKALEVDASQEQMITVYLEQ